MSRKRDTNWNRDEITVLLDSIMEITRMRAEDGKRTNSREVFEHAAKKLGEKGHSSRAEREKCRTKWKKMKEEFTHAKKARDGDSRYKEAPGIQPFYDRMKEFINGNFDNISPHSTIVRRSSSISSSNNTTSNTTTASSSSSNTSCKNSPVSRSSARIAANNLTTTATLSAATSVTTVEADDLSSTTNSALASAGSQQQHKPPESDLFNDVSPRQHLPRLTSGSNSSADIINNTDNLFPSIAANNDAAKIGHEREISNSSSQHIHHHKQPNNHSHLHQQLQLQQTHPSALHQVIPNGDIGSNVYNNNYNNNHNNDNIVDNSSSLTNSHHQNNISNSSMLNHSNDQSSSSASQQQISTVSDDQADISYRVSTGFRQITIFGDHDVDIKFRGDCVTINKINNGHNNICSIGNLTTGFKASGNNNTLGLAKSNNTSRDMEEDECL